jgi:hypothetical protein
MVVRAGDAPARGAHARGGAHMHGAPRKRLESLHATAVAATIIAASAAELSKKRKPSMLGSKIVYVNDALQYRGRFVAVS